MPKDVFTLASFRSAQLKSGSFWVRQRFLVGKIEIALKSAHSRHTDTGRVLLARRYGFVPMAI